MSNSNVTGRVWKFGDGVDTDVLAPGIYMKGPVSELAQHCLEGVRPEFAGDVKAGDIMVAGKNFGIGSSREQAAEVLVMLGVRAVIASSFGGIFYRNAFNLGLPALVCNDVDMINDGDEITVLMEKGIIQLDAENKEINCDVVPEHLLGIVRAGGLMPYLENKMKSSQIGEIK